MRTVCLLIFFAVSLAASVKLYTTDGDFQMVREYQVVGDRVRFYSTDRSDWEEVPLSMVDLKRTAAEAAARQEVSDRQTKEFDDEAAAARAEREELAKIPQDSGVYRIEDGKLRKFPLADITVVTAKGRTALRILVPVPIISGKATVELAGEHSASVVKEDRPEFYFQLDQQESFGLIKLAPLKGVRVAEHIEIQAVTKENVETRVLVPTFTKQLPGDYFYKIWPQDPLPAGEYGLIEYQEGQVELRIWDFRID